MPKPVSTQTTWEVETSGRVGVNTRFVVTRNTSTSDSTWYRFEPRNGQGYDIRELAQLRDWLNDFLAEEGYVSVKLS